MSVITKRDKEKIKQNIANIFQFIEETQVGDWEKLKFSQRQYVTTQILQEYRRKGRAAEMVSTLSTMVKYRNYSVSTKYCSQKTWI